MPFPFVKQLTFHTNRIGKGGFAEVYLCEDTEKLYVVKIGYPEYVWNSYDGRQRTKILDAIKDNLEEKKHLFQEKPFTKLYDIAPKNCYNALYIAELFPGWTIERELGKRIPQNEDLTRKILREYAQMLKSLHKDNMLFVDNNWKNVLISGDDIAICDFDFVSTIKEVNAGRFRNIYSRETCSREQVIQEESYTHSSDLEAFALMIDRIYNPDYFVKSTEEEFWENANAAKKNKRSYPKERQERLPKKLRDILTPLITYPKEESITIDDFLSIL